MKMIKGNSSPWAGMSSPVQAERVRREAWEKMAAAQGADSLSDESYAARNALAMIENSGSPVELGRGYSHEEPVPTVRELMQAGGRKSGTVNSDMAKILEELAAKAGLGLWK